jgi:electron transfer flavoprotein-quinone oxidoreductase
MPEPVHSSSDPIQFDVIVVGAGMAGSAAAAIAARGGLKVALIERGQTPGSKNYFGGALYPHALAEIYPDWQERKPPLERPVTESGFWFLSRDGLVRATVSGGHLNKQPADAIVALRAKFDPWWADQAQKEGAFLIPKTTVVDLLRAPDGRVIGVRTDRPQGDILAPLTILCEGVNNLLTQRLGLIRHDVQPHAAVLAVKQLISLPAETINARFGLPDSAHGLAISVMGDLSMGLVGQGFLYTAGDCISVGLGVMLEDLADNQVRPYELLQRFLSHPQIAPLVAGGQLMEYGAHLIPEGGWREMPALCADGVLIAGDAASMVSALHWEGTNMAIIAGKEAAETALAAHRRKDFSRSALGEYRRRLQKRFVLQDLKQYRGLTGFLRSHPTFMDIYPAFLNDALGMFFTGFGRPKREVYWDILKAFLKRRNPIQAAFDMLAFGRATLGI